MGVADNVAGRQGTARLGYCSCGVFSRHLSGLEPPPHYPALTSSFMPDHELARLSGDFSESRSWKKTIQFSSESAACSATPFFPHGALTGRLRNSGGGGLLLGFLPYMSKLLHPPPPKKISKKQRRLGKWLEVAVPESPEATLAPTTRCLQSHTLRGSRCGWSLACFGLAQVPAPPAAVWIPLGPRPSGLGLPVLAARRGTGPLLLFSLGEDAFPCCFRTRVWSKSTRAG